MATIHQAQNFRSELDAEVLHDALEMLSLDYKAAVSQLISLGVTRSQRQRDAIVNGHQKLYGDYAPDVISKNVKGSTKKGLSALYTPAAERDAAWLREAMVGFGTDEAKLAEVICTRSSAELNAICEAYMNKYKKDLVGDVKGETGGSLQTLLVKLLTVTRGAGPVDTVKASKLAQELYDAGQGRWGTDEMKFIDILTSESLPQLREVFSAYLAKFKKSIIDAIQAEFGGDLQMTLRVLVRAILDPAHYFADKVSVAVTGMGTDEDALIRTIIPRAEVDLQKIKTAYAQKYKKEMATRVSEDVGGDFEELLLAIIQ